MKAILDASGGVVTTFENDELTGKVTIKHTQDVEPILDHNKRLATENDGYSPSREIRRVASIPHVALMKMCAEDGVNIRDYLMNSKHYSKWLRAKCYSSDWSHLLTAPHKS